MTAPTVAPTRSNLLALRRQLAFALEGFELLDQKRQLLALELVRRLEQLQQVEQATAQELARAHQALREATLASGSAALDRAALGARPDHEVSISEQRMMGLHLPVVKLRVDPPQVRFGFTGTTPAADVAQRRFREVLPRLAELAQLQTAVQRLGQELRKAQRRCNAVTKILIPGYRRAIHHIAGTLEEREREYLVSQKRRRGG